MIESFGHITKEEKLHTLHSNILENTFVLESATPFPGYHGDNLPSSSKPYYLFLVTKKNYGFERLARVTKDIHNYFKHPYGARPAELHMFNMIYHAIRIKDLPEYKLIFELQKWFNDMGIAFMKKKNYNKPAIIRVFKHFRLESVIEGIFRDLDDPLMHYLEISSPLPWKLFATITHNIKNNVDNNNFDAATGVIYVGDILDVVRIYEKNPGTDRLSELKTMYEEEIRKVHL